MDDAPRCVVLADYMWKTEATVQATGHHFDLAKYRVLSEVNETVHGLIRGQVRTDLYQKHNAEPLLKAGKLMIERAPKGDAAGTLRRICALLTLLEPMWEEDSLAIEERKLPPVPHRKSKLRKEYRAGDDSVTAPPRRPG
jgi:hypothetical protein